MDSDAMSERGKKEGKTVVGSRSEVKSIVSFHLDVDAGKGGKYVNRKHAIWAIESMPKLPTLIINSKGDEGGFHAYWILEKPVVVEGNASAIQAQARAWNERLKQACLGKLDTTCNLDRVLRCVGVPRLDGGRVCLHSCDFSRMYKLEELVA
jgi:hypothetical protein